MSTSTNIQHHTNRAYIYAIIGVVCIAVTAGALIMYQNTNSYVQPPPREAPVTSSQEPATQKVQPVQAPQEPTAEKTIDIALLEQDIHQVVNQQRESSGVQPLEQDPRLADIARQHSQDMADHQFLSHNTYDGGHNLNYRYAFAGYTCHAKAGSYDYSTSNENIAAVSSQGDEMQIAQDIVNTWSNSFADRYNLLDSQHQTEGIGVSLTKNNMAVYATEDLC